MARIRPNLRATINDKDRLGDLYDNDTNPIYVVRRDSAEGPEVDCFTDLTLAKRWAKHIGARVEVEYPIDRTLLRDMIKCQK